MKCPNCNDDDMACLLCGEVYVPAEPSAEAIERAAIAAFASDEFEPGSTRRAIHDAWYHAMDYQQDRYRRIARAVAESLAAAAAGGESC